MGASPKIKHGNFSPFVLGAGFCWFVFSAAPVSMGWMIPSPCLAEEIPDAVVEFNALEKTTTYRIVSGECIIEWMVHDSENHVVKHRPQCAAPLKGQLPLLIRVGREFFTNEVNARTFRTLFWGGLEPERKPASLELSLRLALAAYQSPEWDLKKGKPKKEDINRFVRDLANRKMIYPELKKLFEGFGRSITVRTVEKVRVLSAAQLPFFDQLKQQGVQAGDKLPFDCLVWFSISKE